MLLDLTLSSKYTTWTVPGPTRDMTFYSTDLDRWAKITDPVDPFIVVRLAHVTCGLEAMQYGKNCGVNDIEKNEYTVIQLPCPGLDARGTSCNCVLQHLRVEQGHLPRL